MKLKIKEFTLVPSLHAEERWDITKEVTAVVKNNNTVKGQPRKDGLKVGAKFQRTEDVGYGVTLENAIEKIIALRLAENEETADLKSFIREYKREKNEILNLLK
jgi:hypothetical protein